MVAPEDLPGAARSLAEDMLSCIPETQAELKKLIDAGHGLALAEALKLETETSKRLAGSVNAEDIAARREQIRDRGRRQV